MCLIEANQPVYPLSIVRQMRDQRAMLIQTPVSSLLFKYAQLTREARGLNFSLSLHLLSYLVYVRCETVCVWLLTTFPTMWYVRPAKPQISLRTCAV